jgi:hypothetical protein
MPMPAVYELVWGGGVWHVVVRSRSAAESPLPQVPTSFETLLHSSLLQLDFSRGRPRQSRPDLSCSSSGWAILALNGAVWLEPFSLGQTNRQRSLPTTGDLLPMCRSVPFEVFQTLEPT